MARSRYDNDVWPDNYREVFVWCLFIGTILGMMFVWSADPYAIYGLEKFADVSGNAPPAPDNGSTNTTLYLDRADAMFMNRIYGEVSVEVAYCGMLMGNRLVPHMADTQEATKDRLAFSIQNCPGAGRPPATIHTHPSGNVGLSMQDKVTFSDNGDDYMCVQGGEITTTLGEETRNLRCYGQTKSGSDFRYPTVTVVIGY